MIYQHYFILIGAKEMKIANLEFCKMEGLKKRIL